MLWSLDADNISTPIFPWRLQTAFTVLVFIRLPTTQVVEGEDFCQQHNHYFFADDNVIFQVRMLWNSIGRSLFPSGGNEETGI
jgi:hypothetical protein